MLWKVLILSKCKEFINHKMGYSWMNLACSRCNRKGEQ